MPRYGLNDEQWRAITAASPTMVNASAGSGKTRCLVAKIRSLLDAGVKPENICAMTFTNKAANEMRERLKKLYSDIKSMQISTIHSMCVRIVKTFPGLTPLKVPFSIYDDGDQLSVIKTILKARDMPENPYDVLSVISRAKSDDAVGELLGNYYTVYKLYQEILKKNNAADFDDLLLYARKCLKHKDCQGHFQKLWPHILVDEVQDTSAIQYEIVRALYGSGTKVLFVVGDENQSIYAFRGARPDNMQDFKNRYNPTVCDLTYNYRSCSGIISHANHFLQFGKKMIAKSDREGQVSLTKFGTQDEEADKIAQAIKSMGNFEETAILYRVNSRSLLFERAFAQNRIPYKVVGDLPFYRRRVPKDLIAALRTANNLSDIESLARIINTPRRGFGEAKKEKLFLEGRPYVEAIAEEMPAIKDFLNVLKDIQGLSPSRAVQEYLHRSGYQASLEKESDLNMVSAFQDVIAGFDTVEELLLASSFLEEDSGHGVRLMTAHASKGLEFDRVFVVGVEDGLWPHKNSEDTAEEARLFYVACSRARKYLNISFSKSRMYRGQPMETYPSSLFERAYKYKFGKDMQ